MTVILIVDRQRRRGARCLESILAQSVIAQLEVLLIDLSDDNPLPGSEHANVRLIKMSNRSNIGTIMAEAVRQATAPIVAFLQEHCVALPGWAETLIAAHQQECAVVVGQVLNDNPALGVSRAVYLVNYARFNDPTERGPTNNIVRHNASYKRDVLLRYDDRLPFFLLHDYLLMHQLLDDGYQIHAEPDARFTHAMETDLRRCWKINFIANRVNAHANTTFFSWSPTRRLVYVAASPLMPWVRYIKLLRSVLSKRSWLLKPSLRFAPHVISIFAFAVLGRAFGILFGTGASEKLFMFYELNEFRGIDGLDEMKIHTPWI